MTIERFFESPAMDPDHIPVRSTLYLLRRDIEKCFEVELFITGTMLIMTGIDLLGKFMFGDQGKQSERFKDCAGLIFCNENPVILYQLRNSVVHSYSFDSEGGGKKYYFTLTKTIPATGILKERQTDTENIETSGTTAIPDGTITNANWYYVNIYNLRNKFEMAMDDIKLKIEKEGHFEEMAEKYGQINITTKMRA